MRTWEKSVAVLVGLSLGLLSPAAAQDSAAAILGLDSLLNTKISTAAKYAQTVTEAASSVTIITSEDIERYGYRTLEDALSTVSGLYFSNNQTHASLSTRGFSRNTDYNYRTLLLVDGAPVNEPVFGSAPLSSELAIPLHGLERIEIVRGPGSALYGTGAMFAVVNLVTKSAAVLDGTELAVQGGSYGQRGGSLLFGRQFQGGPEVTLMGQWDGADGQDLYFAEYDDPETNNGVAHNLNWERRWSATGSASMGGFVARGRYSMRKKAVPTGRYGSDFNAPPTDNIDRHGFFQLSYGRDLGGTKRLDVRSYVMTYGLDAYLTYGGYRMHAIGRGTQVGGETTFRWDFTPGSRLTAGTEVRRALKADFTYDVGFEGLNSRYTVVSNYVQMEQQLGRTVTALGGLRHDSYSATPDALSPRAALVYTPSRSTTLKALFGRAFRAPNLSEAKGGTEADSPDHVVGPETAETFEVMWQQRLGRGLLGTMSVYRFDADGLIQAVSDSDGVLLGSRNVGKAEAVGVEISLEARFGPGLTGYGNYTYQDAMEDDPHRRLSNSPVHMAKGGVSVQPLAWLRPAVELRYESARLTYVRTATEPFLLTNLHVLLTPPLGRVRGTDGHHSLELSLRVNNLFDITYWTPVGVDHRQPAIAQDGRNVSAELRYRF